MNNNLTHELYIFNKAHFQNIIDLEQNIKGYGFSIER